MKLIWLPRAARDLQKVGDDIAHDNPTAANAVELRIVSSVAHLAQFPDAGRPGRVAGTREIAVLPYPFLVVYRVKADEVQVLTVRHTSRLWPE